MILTNPPFGGEEEKGIQAKFPRGQTDRRNRAALSPAHHAETAPPSRRQQAAGAAVVVPNGTLFGDGVCARIKEELLKEFNLHTIVRLPNGVFAPYTGIPTNMLFFDRSGPTQEVWYYEQPLPEGRKNYTKTAPMQFEEFTRLVAWWNKREENDRAWKVPAAELLANGCNLDRKNPRAKEDITHLPPEQLAADILKKEQRIAEIMGNITNSSARRPSMSEPWPAVSLGELLRLERRRVDVEPEKLYQEIGIYCFGRGIFHKAPRTGFEVGEKDLFLMKQGDFILQ